MLGVQPPQQASKVSFVRAIKTTLRPCLQPYCGHGASAHKVRQVDYKLCRAECELCPCEGYLDPVITSANRYDNDGKPITQVEDLPPARSVICRVRHIPNREELRAYWRQKQREHRQRVSYHQEASASGGGG